MSNFASLDLGIILFYLFVIMVVGIYAARSREEHSRDYFLAGKGMGWFAIGSSLFVTNISAEHFLGFAGSGASRGLVIAQFEWIAIFSILTLGWIFAPIFLKSAVFTMPELLGRRFNKGSRLYLAGVSIVFYIFTKISVTLFAGGLLLKTLFGWDIYTSAVIMVVVTGIYTVVGGLRAVMYTQVIQLFFLIAGAALLTFFGLQEAGGFSALQARLPESYFTVFKPLNDPEFPWTGIIFGAPVIAIWYWCTDQYIVQRILSAKNLNHARSATIFAGFLKLLPALLIIVPGMIAVAIFPAEKGDTVLTALLSPSVLPVGVIGIVAAGLLAAIMSSLASVFNSTAALLTMDFYRIFNPRSSQQKLVLIGRITTTLVIISAILWIPLTKLSNTHLYIYLQKIQAYIGPPIAAVFLLGICNKRITGRAAFYTLIGGGTIGFLRLLLELLNLSYPVSNPLTQWFLQINFLHFAVYLFLLSIASLFIISLKDRIQSKLRIPDLMISVNDFKQQSLAGSSQKISPINWNRTNLAFSIILVTLIFGIWRTLL